MKVSEPMTRVLNDEQIANLRGLLTEYDEDFWEVIERSPTGADLIGAERERQMSQEGWTPEHDARHTDASLVAAAVCYATEGGSDHVPADWPWEPQWWKQHDDPIRNLTIAGALIAAEIDRLNGAALSSHEGGQDATG
jgi:hypothetical protein